MDNSILIKQLYEGTVTQPATNLTRKAAEVIVNLQVMANDLWKWKLDNQEMKVVGPSYEEAKRIYGEVVSSDNA